MSGLVLLAQGARRQRTLTPPPSAPHRGSQTGSLTVHGELRKPDYLPSHISHPPKPTHSQSSIVKLLLVTHEWRGERTFPVYQSCSSSQSRKNQIPLEPPFLKNWPLRWHYALEYSIHIWNWLTLCAPKAFFCQRSWRTLELFVSRELGL